MSWNYNRISREKGLGTESLEMFRDSINSSFTTLRFTFGYDGTTWQTNHGKAKGIRDWKTHLCCDSFAIFISSCKCAQGVRVFVYKTYDILHDVKHMLYLYTHESDRSYF